MKTLAVRPPPCYGLLFEAKSQDCQCCLLNDKCKNVDASGTTVQETAGTDRSVKVPKTKAEIILAICKRFNIPTEYTDKQGEKHIITEANMGGYSNLDFLLTSKSALELLLRAKLR